LKRRGKEEAEKRGSHLSFPQRADPDLIAVIADIAVIARNRKGNTNTHHGGAETRESP